MKLQEVIVQHGSPEYDLVVGLRYNILRKPLGMQFTTEQLAAESKNHHLALFHGETPVACLMLLPVTENRSMQMKQVAVDDTLQGQGIGARLIAFAERFARAHGAHTMFCHARQNAVPFYLRQGYVIDKEPFEEIGIPHRYMEKKI